jgi:uncharacterized protein YqkB
MVTIEMRRNVIAGWIVCLFILIFLSCSDDNQINDKVDERNLENISYSAGNEQNMGTLDGRNYTNTFFQFTLEIPEAYKILNKSQYQENLDQNKEKFSSQIENIDTVWENTENNISELVSFVNNDLAFVFQRENLEKIPNVNSALEYVRYCVHYTDKNLSKGYPEYRTFPIQTTDNIGGRKFFVLKYEIIDAPGMPVYYQNTYTAQFDNQLLNIMVNFSNSKSEMKALELLSKIQWLNE